MAPPETPYEAASYELKKFRDRRMADRRFSPWTSEERRVQQQPVVEVDQTPKSSRVDISRKTQIILSNIIDKATAFFK